MFVAVCAYFAVVAVYVTVVGFVRAMPETDMKERFCFS